MMNAPAKAYRETRADVARDTGAWIGRIREAVTAGDMTLTEALTQACQAGILHERAMRRVAGEEGQETRPGAVTVDPRCPRPFGVQSPTETRPGAVTAVRHQVGWSPAENTREARRARGKAYKRILDEEYRARKA